MLLHTAWHAAHTLAYASNILRNGMVLGDAHLEHSITPSWKEELDFIQGPLQGCHGEDLVWVQLVKQCGSSAQQKDSQLQLIPGRPRAQRMTWRCRRCFSPGNEESGNRSRTLACFPRKHKGNDTPCRCGLNADQCARNCAAGIFGGGGGGGGCRPLVSPSKGSPLSPPLWLVAVCCDSNKVGAARLCGCRAIQACLQGYYGRVHCTG